MLNVAPQAQSTTTLTSELPTELMTSSMWSLTAFRCMIFLADILP